eukprot:maker-scaffold_3-snap-gene-8.48-mRNA-1 protein AED:0.01 eAED:0.01 QI:333/1/1/1/1/1/2/263/220
MSLTSPSYDMQLKLLTIGDSGVGKTCLLLRYTNDVFSPTFITTIGIDFKVKNIQINDKRIKLQIWDTAGQERFRTITTSYFRGAQGVLLVYDVSDRSSFENVRNWISQINEHGEFGVDRILVANKVDVAAEGRVVSEKEGMDLAKEFNVPYVETSAKEGKGVNEVFDTLVRNVVKRVESSAKLDVKESKDSKKAGSTKTGKGLSLNLDKMSVNSTKNCCS